MKTQEELRDLVIEVADEIGAEVRSDYSGRCMYGGVCYSIVHDNAIEVIELAGEKGLKGAKIDGMGKDYTIYWEHIKGEK